MNILINVFIFVAGFACGALVIYTCESRAFNSMKEQCELLAEEERRLRYEREEFNNTRDMLDTIDDIPEYLRGKYIIPEKNEFTEDDEDVPEIYV